MIPAQHSCPLPVAGRILKVFFRGVWMHKNLLYGFGFKPRKGTSEAYNTHFSLKQRP